MRVLAIATSAALLVGCAASPQFCAKHADASVASKNFYGCPLTPSQRDWEVASSELSRERRQIRIEKKLETALDRELGRR